MFKEFIARLILFPDVLEIYIDYLRKIHFSDSLVQDIINGIILSYDRFGSVNMNFLREIFNNRDDIDLFMKDVSNVVINDDSRFCIYWVGKFLYNLVLDSLDKNQDDIYDLRQKVIIASDLKSIYEGKLKSRFFTWNFIDEFDKRLETKDLYKYLLKTGISKLDEQVKMTDESVTIFMAPFKRYKSILLTNIGAVALAQGLNVFHIHYEGRRNLWETRYDSCLTGLIKDRLYSNLTPKEKERYKIVFENLKKKNVHLYFMSAIQKRTGLIEIMNELERLKRDGIEFQVIIVDYLNLVKPSSGKKYSDDWIEQGDAAWDLVELCRQGYIVVSAIQTKTKAITKSNLQADDYGRSILIPQAVDNLIAINQDDTEREQGIIRLSPLAVRDGNITESNIRLELMLYKMRISAEIDDFLEKALYLGET